MFDPAPQVIETLTPTRIWKDWVEPEHDAASMLTIAQAMIAHPDNWCQGEYVDYEGNRVLHCAVGAIAALGRTTDNPDDIDYFDDDGFPKSDLLLRAVRQRLHEASCDLYGHSAIAINDDFNIWTCGNPHERVMGAYDVAIQRAMEKP